MSDLRKNYRCPIYNDAVSATVIRVKTPQCVTVKTVKIDFFQTITPSCFFSLLWTFSYSNPSRAKAGALFMTKRHMIGMKKMIPLMNAC
jgi:hypothetical protein